MELHYSQTPPKNGTASNRFTTLWNYTILKPSSDLCTVSNRFTTLWNYTILKHTSLQPQPYSRFTTLWNYTILKRVDGHYR